MTFGWMSPRDVSGANFGRPNFFGPSHNRDRLPHMAPPPQGSAPVSRARSGVTTGGLDSIRTLRANNPVAAGTLRGPGPRLRGGEPREPSAAARGGAGADRAARRGSSVRCAGCPLAVRVPEILARFPREETGTPGKLPVREATGPGARELRSARGGRVHAERARAVRRPGARHTLLGLPLGVRGRRTPAGWWELAQRPVAMTPASSVPPPFIASAPRLIAWRARAARRRDEQELRRARNGRSERLRLMMDSVQDGLWDMHMPTGGVTANRAGWACWATPRASWSPPTPRGPSLGHPEDVPKSQQTIQEHLEGRTPPHRVRVPHAARGWRWSWVLTRARVVAPRRAGPPHAHGGRQRGHHHARSAPRSVCARLIRTLPDIVFRVRRMAPSWTTTSTTTSWPDPPPTTSSATTSARSGCPSSRQAARPDGAHHPRGHAGDPRVLAGHAQGRRALRGAHLPQRPGQALSHGPQHHRGAEGGRLLQQEEAAAPPPRQPRGARARPQREAAAGPPIELEEQQAQLIQAEKLASLRAVAAGVAHEINNPVSYVMSNLGSLDQYVSSLSPLLAAAARAAEPSGESPAGPARSCSSACASLEQRGRGLHSSATCRSSSRSRWRAPRRIKEIAQSLRSFAREDTGEPQLMDVNDGAGLHAEDRLERARRANAR